MARIIFGAAPIHDDGSIIEPACGAGSTVVQAVIHLRDQGIDPAAYRWVLNDYDPMAVALAGVNAVAYGFGPNVELSCQNILTDPELPGERSDSETAGGHPQ